MQLQKRTSQFNLARVVTISWKQMSTPPEKVTNNSGDEAALCVEPITNTNTDGKSSHIMMNRITCTELQIRGMRHTHFAFLGQTVIFSTCLAPLKTDTNEANWYYYWAVTKSEVTKSELQSPMWRIPRWQNPRLQNPKWQNPRCEYLPNLDGIRCAFLALREAIMLGFFHN